MAQKDQWVTLSQDPFLFIMILQTYIKACTRTQTITDSDHLATHNEDQPPQF